MPQVLVLCNREGNATGYLIVIQFCLGCTEQQAMRGTPRWCGTNSKWVRIYFWMCFQCFCWTFFRFSSGPTKCRILQHFLAKLTYLTLDRQHPQHRFQHPPHVRPTSLESPTNRGYKIPKCSWRVDGVKTIMLQTRGHFNPSKKIQKTTIKKNRAG